MHIPGQFIHFIPGPFIPFIPVRLPLTNWNGRSSLRREGMNMHCAGPYAGMMDLLRFTLNEANLHDMNTMTASKLLQTSDLIEYLLLFNASINTECKRTSKIWIQWGLQHSCERAIWLNTCYYSMLRLTLNEANLHDMNTMTASTLLQTSDLSEYLLLFASVHSCFCHFE